MSVWKCSDGAVMCANNLIGEGWDKARLACVFPFQVMQDRDIRSEVKGLLDAIREEYCCLITTSESISASSSDHTFIWVS